MDEFNEGYDFRKEEEQLEKLLPEAPYSVTFKTTGSDGIEYMFTTRAFTEAELFANVTSLRIRVGNKAKSDGPVQDMNPVTAQVQAGICVLHGIPFKEKEGPNGTYWSHGHKAVDGTFIKLPDGKYDTCTGKGYKSEKQPKQNGREKQAGTMPF